MYQITPANKYRMAEVASVFRTSFNATYPNFPELHTTDEDLEYFTNGIFGNDEIYIAEEEGRIVGFIAFNSEFIDHLYLLPEVHRKGIGTQLLDIAKKTHSHLKLWTFQENQPARAFYEKHGFTAMKFTDGSDNEEKQADVLYEWGQRFT